MHLYDYGLHHRLHTQNHTDEEGKKHQLSRWLRARRNGRYTINQTVYSAHVLDALPPHLHLARNQLVRLTEQTSITYL